jgi:hypothetical protein
MFEFCLAMSCRNLIFRLPLTDSDHLFSFLWPGRCDMVSLISRLLLLFLLLLLLPLPAKYMLV